MKLSEKHVKDISTIARAMIVEMDVQIHCNKVTEGNVAIDAAINCLCYAMSHSSDLDDEELLRRVRHYRKIIDLPGSPGERR